MNEAGDDCYVTVRVHGSDCCRCCSAGPSSTTVPTPNYDVGTRARESFFGKFTKRLNDPERKIRSSLKCIADELIMKHGNC